VGRSVIERLRDGLKAFKAAYLGQTIVYRAQIGPPNIGMLRLDNPKGAWVDRVMIDGGGFPGIVGILIDSDDLFAESDEVSLNPSGTVNLRFSGGVTDDDLMGR
jgi:hypothetical protein